MRKKERQGKHSEREEYKEKNEGKEWMKEERKKM